MHSVVICRRGNSWGQAGTEEAETKGSGSPGGGGERGEGRKEEEQQGKKEIEEANPRDRHQARYGYYYCSDTQEGVEMAT